jgi:hypothetical protein
MNPRLIFIFPATVLEIENIYRSQYSKKKTTKMKNVLVLYCADLIRA